MRLKEFLMSTLAEQVGVVVRSYNNKNVSKIIRRCYDAGLRHIFVITAKHFDQGATAGYIARMDSQYSDCVTLVEMGADYSWSTALNRGLDEIATHNMLQRMLKRPEIQFVYNLSVEALIETKDVQQMVGTFTDSQVGVVGCWFCGTASGRRVELGMSYSKPRNTGMMIRLAVFEELAMRFDPRCDGFGGMEDFHFMLLMLACTDYTVEHLEIHVPLVVDVHYPQEQKEQRERDAITAILQSLHNQYAKKVPSLWECIKQAACELNADSLLPG